MYVKNNVVLEPGWISDAFDFREPEFYKLVKTVTRDDESQEKILYPLNDVINRHPLNSKNMRRYLRVY